MATLLSLGAVVLLVLAVLYFVPTIVAMLVGHPRKGLVWLINVLAGWTIVGWIVLLIFVIKTRND